MKIRVVINRKENLLNNLKNIKKGDGYLYKDEPYIITPFALKL